MTRLVSTLALLTALGAPAHAGPTLRSEAIVSGAFVRLGDLIDGAGAKADVALFQAPDLGSTGAVPAALVIEAARQAGLTDVAAGRISEISVTRASRAISADEIQAAVAERAAAALGADANDIAVTLADDGGARHFDADAIGAIEIVRFALDPATGRFDAAFEVVGRRSADGEAVRATGLAVATVEVTTLNRALGRGDIVSESDLKRERRPRGQNPASLESDLAPGLAARRPLREGQVLRAGDLVKPQHVERGGFVTLVYALPGMSLSLKAKALANGASGDLVAVQNLQSKRVVNGVVTGPSEVTVSGTSTAVARR